jgi:hypothetical protein
MVRRLALFAAILVFVAWGPKGHEVVGTIAKQLLNDDTENVVNDLLGNVTLASVANWTDESATRRSMPTPRCS